MNKINKILTDLEGKKYIKINESKSYSYEYTKKIINNRNADYLLVVDKDGFEVAKFYKKK